MAHFYGSMRGSRKEITRTGTKKSGLVAHIRGWNIGGRVSVWRNANGKDVVTIYVTRGSKGSGPAKCLGKFVEGEDF